MDRLSQIRKEISIENGYSSWPELSAIEPKIKVSMLQDEVARRYATEVARHNLSKAADQAKVQYFVVGEKTDVGELTARVDKESILKLEIELL